MHYQIWLKQSTVTHPAVCHDKVVNQQFAACSGSPHDDNHLTSTNSKLVLATHVKPQYIALPHQFCAVVTHQITCCKTGVADILFKDLGITHL